MLLHNTGMSITNTNSINYSLIIMPTPKMTPNAAIEIESKLNKTRTMQAPK